MRSLFAFVAIIATTCACAPRTTEPPRTASAAGEEDESNIRPGSTEVTPVSETSTQNANASTSSASATAGEQEVPTTCVAASKDDLCVPDPGFVKRLCNASYPDVALVLMAKDSAFTRMYMKGDVDGWNADGGASVRSHLDSDEEVLALKKRPPPANGIVVGASGGFLVMRWDGSCFTLDDGEVTTKRPPNMKHGPIPWRTYSDRTKEALLKNPRILAAFQRRGKECKGATSGTVSLACEKADTALSAIVVTEVRTGVAIPRPDRRP